MRILILSLLLLVSAAFMSVRENPLLIHRLIVQSESQLSIDGKTNVNSFKCAIPHYVGKDTLVLQEGGPNMKPVFVKGSVSLDASSFDCGMAVMTSDFLKTIKSNSFPAIIIDFILFERAPRYDSGEEKFKGIIKISLGGTTKVFEMDCVIQAKPSGLIHLSGSREFKFSDFYLEAPTRMFGLVRVQELLQVNFHLVLKLDANS